MNIGELMIDNWVIRDGNPERINFICKDNEDAATYESYVSYPVHTYEPVSLTGEILLANGFRRYKMCNGVRYYLGIDNNSKVITIYWFNHYFYGSIGDKHHILTAKDYIKGVHELQNMLRLAGEYELADNFKIK